MENILLRISFIISFIYLAYGYLNNQYLLDFVIKAIILFIVISLVFLLLNYLFLKFLCSAKIKLIEENMANRYYLLEDIISQKKEEKEAEN